jgi:hypothetical protein
MTELHRLQLHILLILVMPAAHPGLQADHNIHALLPVQRLLPQLQGGNKATFHPSSRPQHSRW